MLYTRLMGGIMRSLSVSSARSKLPSLLDDVFTKRETIVISRNGKPVAQLTPIPSDTYTDDAARFPLRGIPLTVVDDFDEPCPELWEALEQ